MRTRVLLVDRDQDHRRRFARRLIRAPDLELVAEVAPGLEVLRGAANHRPDVIVVHVQGSFDGELDSCGPLASLEPRPLVLVLGDLNRRDTERAERSGADAVVSPAVRSRPLARLLRSLVSHHALGASAWAARATAVTSVEAALAGTDRPVVRPSGELDLLEDQGAILLRMQRDLRRAMARPIGQRRWAMVVDRRRCIGSASGSVACVGANHAPPPVPSGPVGATPTRPDGIVKMAHGRPIGCWKCRFCLRRLNAGMLPACTTTCVGAATYFGDRNDPESLVSHLIANQNVKRLREGEGGEMEVHCLR